ncbi:MAG: DUF6498-containing protein [Smithella sp.]|jgi:hypothetical protein
MEWSVACLFLSYGFSFMQNYLGKKEYTSYTAMKLLIQPYKRIFILHLTVCCQCRANHDVWLTSFTALRTCPFQDMYGYIPAHKRAHFTKLKANEPMR